MPLIDGAELGYGARVVLRNVTFALEPGERVALLGRSGAGKSTLLSAIYARMADRGEQVALIPQDNALVPQLSVFHNVYMGRLDRHGALYNALNLVLPQRRERSAMHPILEATGLLAEETRPVEALSGGQKQRTAIARAMFRGGSVLLGDEPLSALDERQSAGLLASLKTRFSTMVLALHDVDVALGYATRVVGIRGGRIAFDVPNYAVERRLIDDLYRA